MSAAYERLGRIGSADSWDARNRFQMIHVGGV